MTLDYLTSVKDIDLILDHLLIVLAETCSIKFDFDKEWMGLVVRADKREDDSNRYYYEHTTELKETTWVKDPNALKRLYRDVEWSGFDRLSSAMKYVKNHNPKLLMTLNLVLANGAKGTFASYLSVLKTMLEAETSRRSGKSSRRRRCRTLLRWRGTATGEGSRRSRSRSRNGETC